MFGLASRTPMSGSRPARATPSPRCGPTPITRGCARDRSPDGADAMTFGPHTAKLLRAADRHRRRCARLARCRQLSLQLSELARDRGDVRDGGPRLAAFVHVPPLARDGARQRKGCAARHAGRTGRCRRGDAAGDGAAGAEGRRKARLVRWAKRHARAHNLATRSKINGVHVACAPLPTLRDKVAND